MEARTVRVTCRMLGQGDSLVGRCGFASARLFWGPFQRGVVFVLYLEEEAGNARVVGKVRIF